MILYLNYTYVLYINKFLILNLTNKKFNLMKDLVERHVCAIFCLRPIIVARA